VARGIAYGTAELADLCSFARPTSEASRVKAISLALARHPRRARTLLSLRVLPIVEPRLSAAEHDRWLQSRWPPGGESLFGGHWAQAVIQTSLEEHEYLAGRHRQAVRTNIHRAREQGVTATQLSGYDEFAAASTPVYGTRRGGDAVLSDMRSPPTSDKFAWYSASTAAHETPIIIAAVALFGDFGVLAVMVGNRRYPRVGHARYLLHTHILGDLAARGTRHLIVGSVLRQSNGSQYFQKLLGYRVCNVRPIVHLPSGDRRVDAAAAMRRLLMTGPVVDNVYQSSCDDSQRITSPAFPPAGHSERAAMRNSGNPSVSEVAVTTRDEDRRSAL
jgi:hypothetical protein